MRPFVNETIRELSLQNLETRILVPYILYFWNDAIVPYIIFMTKIFTPYILENGNAKVMVLPERGGLVTSLVLNGVEVLYQGMLEETLYDLSKSVKGGIPILFPNAGPLSQEAKDTSGFSLPQHGFARTNAWSVVSTTSGEFKQKLESKDISEKYGYDYDFSIANTITLVSPTKCRFEYVIENTGNTDLPVSFGLHPYFQVPNGDKAGVQWNFVGDEIIAKNVEVWQNDGTVRISLTGNIHHFEIPKVGVLEMALSSDFHNLWVRSLPGKDFVCIEPVQNNEDGLVKSPIMVKSGEKLRSMMEISLILN